MRKWNPRATALLALLAGVTAFSSTASARPITVTITKATNLSTDLEDSTRGEADFYAGVTINGVQQNSFANAGDGDDTLEPFWSFSVEVPDDQPTVPIQIQLWDWDDCDYAFCSDTPIFQSDDDQADVDPVAGNTNLDIVYDVATKTWTGDSTTACSTGDFAASKATVCWDISDLSTSGDADGDGLLDSWEQRGFDANGDGVIDDGTNDVLLQTMGADPLHKDLFLEMDVMTGTAPLTQSRLQRIKDAFSNAPITNPDGVNGVNFHLDLGGITDPGATEDGFGACNDGIDNGGGDGADAADPDCLAGENLGGGSFIPAFTTCGTDAAYYANKATNFNSNRRWVFRYSVSGVQASGCTPSGGQGEIGGNDFINFNGASSGTIMHELGHNLNLHHGGDDDINCKPNYVSVMNYDLQSGIPQNGGGTILDYSPPRTSSGRGQAPLPFLDEDDLNDSTILDPTDKSNNFVFVNALGNKVQNPLTSRIDWDGDGITGGLDEEDQDVNSNTAGSNGSPAGCVNSTDEELNGHNDWAVVSIPFRQFGDSASAAINPVSTPEPTQAEMDALSNEINRTDLAVTKADSADPSAAGTLLAYTITVHNKGLNPAQRLRLVDTLPAGLTFVGSDTPVTMVGADGTLTWDLGMLETGGTKTVTVTVKTPSDLVHNNGGPVTLTNVASASNLNCPSLPDEVCEDAHPDDNTASETTKVIAVADLDLLSFETLAPPSQLLLGQTVTFDLKSRITQHGPSSPMDTSLTVSASAPAGVTVTPAASSQTAPALNLGEERTLTSAFTLGCTEPGVHAVTFTGTVSPARSADMDPNPANNTLTAPVEFDCVVPVAVNVKPGSAPNPVNLNPGAVPVAVLTTVAGEYGLPVAFNATTIDPLTVKFGAVDEVWAGTGGAGEFHGIGHPERSLELDEKTKDGDLDLVLHFRANETGLSVGMTKAAVKGSTWPRTGSDTASSERTASA